MIEERKVNFIEKAILIHGPKYDYSKAEYLNTKTKICIICPKHGEFWQRASSHLDGYGCKICSGRKLSTQSFINKACIVHRNKYDYSKTNYTVGTEKVIVICPEHGQFTQYPGAHLLGVGCKKCGSTAKLTIEEFIERSNKIHNNKYDYSKSLYINCRSKIDIICPKHGVFKQKADGHINGRGCPTCSNEENVNEIKLLDFIKNTFPKLLVESQYTSNWLEKQSLDIYLPDHKIGVEYQGDQHFSAIKFFGGEKRFKEEKIRDSKKYSLCKENGVNLLYFTYNKKAKIENFFSKVYTDQNELIKSIKECLNN